MSNSNKFFSIFPIDHLKFNQFDKKETVQVNVLFSKPKKNIRSDSIKDCE